MHMCMIGGRVSAEYVNGVPCLLMPYVLPVRVFDQTMVLQVEQAIRHCATCGVLHTDVALRNVAFISVNSAPICMLIDFESAELLSFAQQQEMKTETEKMEVEKQDAINKMLTQLIGSLPVDQQAWFSQTPPSPPGPGSTPTSL
jgi:hypothetical protein